MAVNAYHLPRYDTVFHHEVADEWCVDVGHVVVVVFFGHAGFAVGADGPAEETLCLWGFFYGAHFGS